MKTFAVALTVLLFSPASLAQARHTRPARGSASAADGLGRTCPEILAMSSTDWVATFQKEKGMGRQETIAAIDVYGKCYDERTDRIAALLARKRAGPSRSALADFAGFEEAVKTFTKTAIADAQPTPSDTRVAYAHLYAKQFRYELYREYERKNMQPRLTPQEDIEFTKAKNRFGELIGVLPDAKAHQVHAAFGEIVGAHQISMMIKFAVYRYAIFVLEPPSEKPFAPPPF
jgi:hypothetical protein